MEDSGLRAKNRLLIYIGDNKGPESASGSASTSTSASSSSSASGDAGSGVGASLTDRVLQERELCTLCSDLVRNCCGHELYRRTRECQGLGIHGRRRQNKKRN